MRLYYDWLDHIEPLSDAEFREVIVAAARYSQNGTEPPAMTGAAGMAMRFMVADMERYATQAEAGSRGGKKRAKNEALCDTLQAPLKGSTRVLKHIDIDKDIDIDIDNNYDYDYDYDEDKDKDKDENNARGRGSSSEVVEMFREICPSLAQGQRISTGLAEKIRKAEKQDLRQLFTKAEATPFLRGEGKKGWKASLSWVLERSEEIMAGKYDAYEKPESAGLSEPFGEADLAYWESVRRERTAKKGENE